VALKHLRKLFVDLAPQGVKMADLLHIFVELADEQILNEKIKPALYRHYLQLVEKYPMIHLADPLL
jgi:hypothetical protein